MTALCRQEARISGGVLVHRLREREEPIVVVLHFQLVGIAAGLVFLCFSWRTPLPWEWFCLLMCGVLTQIGQVCLTP
jgi:drug/metabolite transporter (DMT)-like permease